METKQCRACGSIFVGSRNRTACSDTCRRELLRLGRLGKTFPGRGGVPRRTPESAHCVVCGSEFRLSVRHAANKKKTCSPECLTKFRRRHSSEQPPRAPRPVKVARVKPERAPRPVRVYPTEAVCQACGKVFPLTQREAKYNKRTCSERCRNALYSQAARKHNGRKPERTCEGCGRVYEIGRYEISQGNRFCANACRLRWFSALTPMGEANPYWKGGVRSYYGPSWRAARRAAWLRDNETCTVCGKDSESLGYRPVVHHRRPFKVFGLDRHEEANRLENLMCLCRSCHMKEEWQLGRAK